MLMWTRPLVLTAIVAITSVGIQTTLAILSNSLHDTPTKAHAVLDVSHFPEYPRNAPQSFTNRLFEVFVRHHRLLLRESSLTRIHDMQPKWWVIMAPNRPYSDAEATKILAWVHGGGNLLVIAGYPHRAAVLPFLKQLNIDIQPGAHGAAHNSRLMAADWRAYVLTKDNTNKPPKNVGDISPSKVSGSGYDAEINFQESYPLRMSGTERVLVESWGKPLAINRTFGGGKIVWIADSAFCTADNLGARKMNEKNIRFLIRCLE
jgi:hypothetical protein